MRTRTMGPMLIFFVLGANALSWHCARAEEPAANLQENCRSWARNAMMGVNVHSRGGNRQITYIDENQLRYLLKHQAAGDNLYLLKGEYTATEKRFLEESVLSGYDRSQQWWSSHAGQTPDTTTWESEIFQACLKNTPQAVRDLLVGP